MYVGVFATNITSNNNSWLYGSVTSNGYRIQSWCHYSSFPPCDGSGFKAYVALDVSSWSLVPTSTDTGIFVSGAQDFCNDAFASSTGIGATIGNGLCVAGGFLFIPSSDSLSQWSSMPQNLEAVVPFSYFFDVKNVLNGSSASTTQNLPTYSIDLGVLDAASSTAMGRILPTGNFSFFSTTTINRYLPAGMHDLLYFLMQSAIWVGMAFYLYHKVVPKHANV